MSRPKRAALPRLSLRKKLERTLAQGHPWIWRNALDPHYLPPGTPTQVVDQHGAVLANGIAEAGPIAVRVFSTDPTQVVDAELFARRIEEAAALRRRVVPPATDAFRVLHGEGDRIPGVVCDVYRRWAVLKFDGEGARHWRDAVAEGLRRPLDSFGVDSLLIRGARGDDGCETVWGNPPAGPIVVEERGMRLFADLAHGQKTGLFLDHRESRARVRELSRGSRVLNLFGYTGAFSVAAGLGGATWVRTVDLAGAALGLAEASWMENGQEGGRHQVDRADAFAFLAQAAARREKWDLVIADPPSFAPSEAALPAALASYKKLHAACFAVLERGGLYLAASCSSHVRRAAFDETIAAAAARARRALQWLDAWGAPPDHPRLTGFPEGDYLKSALVRAL